eukprot:CAMPEP_0201944170 /NCGR_PEP_ID=MMETSP0903-20130614/52615_1 /ASSEMBLY_ACC=CAM_ASM_000552 /TAXON_ID=420261 /ORGANISM="Thalassiosira antarctica, Strain CCMP982" /LENGTH=228 /DNA_ID=CAMNT_0048487093 /DNA_START=44 /DNA_END=730 /DNA_ORIENTATION=+
MSESSVVYVGIPLTPEGAISTFVPSLASKSDHSITAERASGKCKMYGGYGLLAFILGAFLALFAWIANQGWTIVSLLLFGQFTWTLESAWRQVLLSLFGSVTTAIAFYAVWEMIFPEVEEDEDDDNDKSSLFKKDISDAFQDLGELGFVVGYFSSQAFFTALVYKPFAGLGIRHENNNGLSSATLVIMMLWVLSTKMRDYRRAVNRANNVEHTGKFEHVGSSAYAQFV